MKSNGNCPNLSLMGISLALALFMALAPKHAMAQSPSFPINTVNIDEPGRIPYQGTASVHGCNTYVCAVQLDAVPNGKRLVVQEMSVVLLTESGPPETDKLLVELGSTQNPSVFFSFVTAPFQGYGGTLGAFAQQAQFTFDAAQTPAISLYATVPVTDVYVTLIGYEVDCQIAKCVPIATK